MLYFLQTSANFFMLALYILCVDVLFSSMNCLRWQSFFWERQTFRQRHMSNTNVRVVAGPLTLGGASGTQACGRLPSWANLLYYLVYYTILYYIYYTILYYTVLYYTILYYTILYCTIYTVLYYTILYCTVLYYNILYYTILYYTILYYNII